MCAPTNPAAGTPAASTATGQRIELPKHAIPRHYSLVVDSNMTDFTYKGKVTIDLDIVAETSFLKLNALELEIQSAKILVGAGGERREFATGTPEYDADEQTVVLPIDGTLGAGLKDVQLVIDFTGTINNKMMGYYRSTYTDLETGAEKVMGVTQFEATEARRALPCFDEPKLKATFDVTLIVDKHLTALSNTEVVEDKEEGEKRVVKFAKTPIMSTYLLAWAIGEFEWIEAFTRPTAHLPTPVRCRVYTTKGSVNKGRFALACAVKTLELFSEIFGVAYPLTKCDQIAVPDFAAGAMENWGLITYRTVALLVDDEKGSIQAKTQVATTVTHELAHQWFGNLVTFVEWDELWLNEGFATWVGTYGAGVLFPEWDIWTQFIADDQSYALNVDGLRSSHPIQVEVLDAKEIDQIFDSISYSKGASVIHMLTQWLGTDVFFEGIRKYIARHAYQNATTLDLWAALSEVSGRDVGAVMGLWTSETGYPVLSVTESALESGSGSGSRLHLSQKRYLRTGDVKPEEDQVTWPLPLNIAAVPESKDKVPRVVSSELMTAKKLDVDLVTAQGAAVPTFLVNQDRSGLYRVAYGADHLRKLGAAAAEGRLPTRDRLALLDDAFSLARAGYMPTAQFLDLVLTMVPNEREYVVLAEAALDVNVLRGLLYASPEQDQERVNALRRAVFAPHAKRIGFEGVPGESPLMKLLRPTMVSHAGMAGHKEVVAEAQARFAKFIAGDQDAIAPELFRVVFHIVVSNGGQAEWDQVLNVYKTTEVTDQKYAALTALGQSKSPEIIAKALDLSVDDKLVRPGDIHYIFGSLGGNPAARRATWAFLVANWDMLAKRYEGQFGMLGGCVSAATSVLATRAELDEVKAFFADKDTKAFSRKLAEVYDRTEALLGWIERDGEAVKAWLEEWELKEKYGY
ncbi:aminopeptidase 2 [Catenaria anguillulae PL171]|uniref:Aminopeptidase n=1 Tax=Catenaria anguillulae PL171 TaxID=765915 RepID=A0A1Y2HEG6_9FUNG|nr:aminopeptidase 2 [Catenaria anguillulae PL171]